MNETERSGWTKVKPIRHVLEPSGRVCYLRRPSPALALKTGKMQRLLNKARQAGTTAQSVDEVGWAMLSALDNNEAEQLAENAIDLIIDVMVEPRIYREPSPEQFGVADLGADFWPLYSKAMALFSDAPVELENGETTVESVVTFPGGQAPEVISGKDGEQVQGAPC